MNKAAGEALPPRLRPGLRAALRRVLRLTNTYGPRMRVKDDRQTFLGTWLRLAVEGEELLVFGDGNQRRDFTYVDDAVEAFLLAGARPEADGEIFNVGGEPPVSLLRARRAAGRAGGGGSYRSSRSPRSGARSTSATTSPTTGRSASASAGSRAVGLREGLARSLDYYREHAGGVLVDGCPVPRPAAARRRPLASRARGRVRDRPRARAVRRRAGARALRGRVRRVLRRRACGRRQLRHGRDRARAAGARRRPRRRGDHRREHVRRDDHRDRRRRGDARARRRRRGDLDARPGFGRGAITPTDAGARAGAPVRAVRRPGAARARLRRARPDAGRGRRAGARRGVPRPRPGLGPTRAYSFYPTKNLGALGDAGAVVTNDAEVAERAARCSAPTASGPRRAASPSSPGVNSRLDEIQAEILSRRLARLDEGNERRRAAGRLLPRASWRTRRRRSRSRREGPRPRWHLFVVLAEDRDAFRATAARARRRDARPLPGADPPPAGVRAPRRRACR